MVQATARSSEHDLPGRTVTGSMLRARRRVWRCRASWLPVVLLAGTASAQPHAGQHEFAFARLQHHSAVPGDWPRWSADWPEAERHFLHGLDRLTAVDTARDGVVPELDDAALFDHPWLYAVEPGAWLPDVRQAQRLREYLLRGGFPMVDDFHGAAEWAGFLQAMSRVFPDRAVEELGVDAEAFAVLYDLRQREQVAGIRALLGGRTWEKGGRVPRWRGVFDDTGRVMVAINFNQDLGDAWEHADDRRYPERLTAAAYRLGVNYVIYAMTH